MKLFKWRDNKWYRYAVMALTLILFLLLVSHPELRLLIPVVDALGLDLLAWLIGAQLIVYARPVVFVVNRAIVLPLANRVYALVIYFLGIAGPYADARITCWRISRSAMA